MRPLESVKSAVDGRHRLIPITVEETAVREHNSWDRQEKWERPTPPGELCPYVEGPQIVFR